MSAYFHYAKIVFDNGSYVAALNFDQCSWPSIRACSHSRLIFSKVPNKV